MAVESFFQVSEREMEYEIALKLETKWIDGRLRTDKLRKF